MIRPLGSSHQGLGEAGFRHLDDEALSRPDCFRASEAELGSLGRQQVHHEGEKDLDDMDFRRCLASLVWTEVQPFEVSCLREVWPVHDQEWQERWASDLGGLEGLNWMC